MTTPGWCSFCGALADRRVVALLERVQTREPGLPTRDADILQHQVDRVLVGWGCSVHIDMVLAFGEAFVSSTCEVETA